MKKLLFIPFLFISTICFAKTHDTTWIPDTHPSCTVVYTWDDTSPQSPVTGKTVNCTAEDSIKGLSVSDAFAQVLEENQRKNKAVKEIMDADPALTEVKDGSTVLKPDVSIQYSYDKTRKLHLAVNGAEVLQSEKPDLQTAVDAQLGSDKVSVE